MAYTAVTYTFSNSTVADATQVNQNYQDIVNGLSDGTKDINCSAFSNTGNTTIGDGSGDDLTINASLASTIPIKTTNTYDIGSTTKGLRALYWGANSQTVNIIASSSMSATWTLTLPVTAGTANYALLTNGSGVTTWTEIPLFSSNKLIVKAGTGKGIEADSAGLIYIGESTATGVYIGKSSGTNQILGATTIDTSTSSGNLLSNTYTPTLTNTTNVTSSAVTAARYTRVGNTVTVSFAITVDPTSTGAFEIGLTLPIASNFSSAGNCAGTGWRDESTSYAIVSIIGDATNDRATLSGFASFTGNSNCYGIFQYTVI